MKTIASIAVLNLALGLMFLSTVGVSAQPIYWDYDGTTAQFLDSAPYSEDQAGTIPTFYQDGSDIVFSADPVTNPSETVDIRGGSTYQDVVNSFTFDKGSITFQGNLPSTPTASSLFIESGINVNTGSGTITFGNLLGPVSFNGDDNGNSYISNNSTSDLIFNSGFSATPGTNLYFQGTGTGAVQLNGKVTGSLEQDSTTSKLEITGTNNTGFGSLIVNGGTVVVTDESSINDSAINLQNGGTLSFTSAITLDQSANVTGGGTINLAGDSLLNWGNGNSNTVTADTLTLGSGDDLDTTRGSQNIQTLDLVGSGGNASTAYRLIVGIQGQGLGLLNGVSTINAGAGYTFDFGSSGTVASTVNFASGSVLEARNNVGVTLTNAILPTSGTWYVGNDDVGSTDSFYLPSAQTVNGTLTINMLGGGVSTHLQGAISGTGGLTFAAPGNNGSGAGTVYLDGTNTYQGPTILAATSGSSPNVPVVAISGDSSGIGHEIDVNAGTLVLADGAKIPTGSTISLGNPLSGQNSDNLSLQIGMNGGANVTVYNVLATSNWNNPNDREGDRIDGSGSTMSTLTWDVASGTDTFQGVVGNGNGNLTLVKTGAGTLSFTSSNNHYFGGTTINQGIFAIGGGGNYGAGGSAAGGAPITINNAAELEIAANNGNGLLDPVIVGTSGTYTSQGDSYTVGGLLAGVNDIEINNTITGGTGLAVVGGDILEVNNGVNSPGSLDVLNPGTRLLLFNSALAVGATSITVADGGTLDFGMGDTETINTPIRFGANASIEQRGSNVTLTNVQPVVGTSGNTSSLTLGSDDVGNGSITISNNVVLAGNVQLLGAEPENRGITTVNFSGGFSGTGNLTMDSPFIYNYSSYNRGIINVSGANSYKGDTTVSSGVLDLSGDNTAVTNAAGGAPNYYIVASNPTSTDSSNVVHSNYLPGFLQVGNGGTLASNANVVVGGGSGFAYFVLGDGNGAANVNVGNISVAGSGNDNGSIIGGASSTSTLTVNVAAGKTDTYNGIFGSAYNYDFNQTSIGAELYADDQNLGVVFNLGAGSTMELGGFNNNASLTGGFTVNGGTLLVDGNAGALGFTNVTLNNAAFNVGNNQYFNTNTDAHVIIGTGTVAINGVDGIDTLYGDVQSGAGSTLHVSGSNLLLNSDGAASTIGTLDVDGGRVFLIGSNGLNFIANNTAVNVNNGAILDIATGTTATINNKITFSNGSGLVTRNNGSVYTLTDAILPGAGSFTIGTDDTNPSGSAITISNNQALTGDLTLHVTGNSYLPVTLSGNISGTGGISEDSGGAGTGNLYLSGTNTYTGQTSAVFANMFIDGDNSGAGANYFTNFGTITIGHNGKIASNANLQFGNGGGYGTYVLGDANGAVSQTVAALTMLSNGTSYVYNGNTLDSTNSVLTVNNASGNDTYTGILGNNATTNGNNLALVKSGAGTLTLSGANTYAGGTTVNGGRLAVDGSIAGGALVNVGAEIGGHGYIAGGISGGGAVGPGNSPGILTAAAVNPAAGMSFNFEFTLQGMPNYANAAASGNDVLHLEGGMPFTSALTSTNDINLYFAGAGDYQGGFFTNGLVDTLTTNIANATYIFYVLDNANGTYTYNGNRYDLTTGIASTVPAVDAAFADGATNGFTENFVVTGIATPEPSTYALIGAACLVLLAVRRRRSA